jgi:uncharacterized protein YcbK (DUF882 family)
MQPVVRTGLLFGRLRRPWAAPAVLVAAATLAALPDAHADTTHVVARGHTIETIAHRYRVSVKSIIDANHLKDPKHLRIGETLIIPGVNPPKGSAAATKKGDAKPGTAGAHPPPAAPPLAAAAPAPAPPKDDPPSAAESSHSREIDMLRAMRLGEHFTVRMKDRRGKIPPPALKSFERMMRSGNAMHPVDPRLVALVGIVSSHFGGKTIEVVSGFRPYSPTQYTPHSNHNYGKALDFRIQGVKNEELRDFCRTLRNAGVGYYPSSTFVHLDVRDAKAYWVDYSKPGEAPRYDRPGVAADEGTSDVPDESAPATL